jgi:hypothetical protein
MLASCAQAVRPPLCPRLACRQGLYKNLFLRIMSIHGAPQLKLLSPVYVAAHGLRQHSGSDSEDGSGSAGMEGDAAIQEIEVAVGPSSCSGSNCKEGQGLLLGQHTSSANDLIAAGWELPAVTEVERSSSAVGEQQQQQEEEEEEEGKQRGERFLHAESAAFLYGAKDRGKVTHLAHGSFAGSSAGSLFGATALGAEAAAGGVAGAEPAGEGAGSSPVELMPHMLLLHGDADRY